MATFKLEPPSFVSEKKSYEAYKRELKIWSIATGVSKDKQALVVTLSIYQKITRVVLSRKCLQR